MKLPHRRHFLHLAAGAAALPAVSRLAKAQVYPARPVRMIVPLSAGSAADILARQLALKMGESWSQPVVVENRPGAGTTLGTDAVAKAAPDGHTLLVIPLPLRQVQPYIKSFPTIRSRISLQ
jgi:tripartite-type tricarboxylate transporter receptor subunit TctC